LKNKPITRTFVTLLCALSLVLFAFGFQAPALAAGSMVVNIIDVGQADAILVQLPDGKNMMVDGGNNADGPAVVNYLRGKGVNRVDYVVGTHPHEDHIGGLDDVINNFDIGQVYLPDKTSTTQSYEELINAIQNKGLTITTAKAGVIMFNTTADGKTLSAVMVAPNSNYYEDTNDYSAVIRLVFGATSFLLTGDAEAVSEQEMVNSGQNLSADVLKVGHHGSYSSTTEAFLNAVNPSAAVISVGLNNPYGHPHQETIDRLKAHGIDIYRTDMQGAVTYTTSGSGYQVNVQPWWSGGSPSPGAGLVINEVFPAPNKKQKHEWIELYNPGDTAVDIGGYQIDDIAGGGQSPYTIPAGTVVPARGYWVWQTDSYFNNSGDDARLIKPDGTVADSYTYDGSAYDKSWYRYPDGGNWSAGQDGTPTPGAANN